MTADYVRGVFDACGTDKGVHGYAEIYAQIPREIQSIFEIGVSAGCSLRAWEILFPSAAITGLDVSLMCSAGLEGHDIRLIKHDIKTYEHDGAMFDLIVDDGSHDLNDQLQAFEKMWPYCRGTYVIEDVGEKNAKAVADATGGEVTVTGPRYDDRVVVNKR